MTILAILATAALQTSQWSEAQWRNLALERGEFDIRMVMRNDIQRYERIGSWIANYHNEAFYPVGVSSRRYIFSDPENILIAQSRHGTDAKTDWVIQLQPIKRSKPPSSMHGTLRRYLWLEGFRVKSRHLSAAQRASLDTSKDFASFYEDTMVSTLECGLIYKDGTRSESDHYNSPSPKQQSPPLFPITQEEMTILGAGNKRWHGPGKYQIRRAGEDVKS